MSVLLPGSTIGVLGGGQLGRMLALAARPMGYHLHTLDPDPSCAARHIVERCVAGALDDPDAALAMARGCDVVTLEIEKVSIPVLDAVQTVAPVRPGPHVLAVVQDRGRQKAWLRRHGFPLGPYQDATSAAELQAAIAHFGGARCFVKSNHGGYDGRGQVVVHHPSESETAWTELGQAPVVVERAVDLQAEISVMVARRPSGPMAVFPVALNHHEDRVLATSVLPAPVPPEVAQRAVELGLAIAEQLDVVGLLAIELFLTTSGEVLVNELAPRPHNSFHATEVACATSQFEQGVRAVCDLPLGSTEVLRPAAIHNLLGEVWLGPHPPRWDAALALPGVRLHLYGKRGARPGRKMGHLSATGPTPEEAVRRVVEATRRLTQDPPENR